MKNTILSNSLILIPARGGSKGIPEKNIKLLGGKPLIHYSIEYARNFIDDQHICVSTNDLNIIACANNINLKVPFVRPDGLATDRSSSFEVMHHALHYYKSIDKTFKYIVLLQPTSPFRLKKHLVEAFQKINEITDVVVSAYESPLNPYYNLYEIKTCGFAKISKGGANFIRRQDIPPAYAFNGSIYIFKVTSLRKARCFGDLERISLYEMEKKYSYDLDTPEDWTHLEFLYNKGYFADPNSKLS